MKSERSDRIVLFGGPGYMSVMLSKLIEDGCNVVGLCTLAPPNQKQKLRESVGKFLCQIGVKEDHDFIYSDPFSSLSHPWYIARRSKIEILRVSELRSKSFESRLAQLKPDIILVAGFHRLIPRNIIDLAAVAAINFHPSYLPRHRGGTPNRWIVRFGEHETGLTAHWLDAKFDTGDILHQRRLSVGENDTWGDVENKILNVLPTFMDEVLYYLKSDNPPRNEQDESVASYKPSYKGPLLNIDWTLSVQEIQRTCLAIRPKSGGRSAINGVPVCIWDTRANTSVKGKDKPGTIVTIDHNGNPIVQCGQGECLTVIKVLRNGLIRSGSDLTGKAKLKPGDRFDVLDK